MLFILFIGLYSCLKLHLLNYNTCRLQESCGINECKNNALGILHMLYDVSARWENHYINHTPLDDRIYRIVEENHSDRRSIFSHEIYSR